MNILNKSESLARISKNLMLTEPYYGFFLIMLNKLWDSKRVPTAGVSKNGINYQLTINPEFWESLSEDHRYGLLKHELLHIAFGHLTTFFKFTNKKLANVAMDCEINQYISKQHLPEGGIDIDNYTDIELDRKAGARYYYDKLNQLQDEKDKNGTTGDPNMDQLLDNIENGDIPDHSTWEDFEDLTEAEQKLIEKQLQKVLTDAKEQTEKKRGTVPGEIEGLIIIEEIVKPKFDWRGFIRRFTGISTKVYTKKTRRKENRKFPDNPGLKVKMRQHMLLAIDTSGSVSDDELKEFMNEIHHIYKAGVEITIIQCDTVIKSIEAYKGKFEMTVQGRGGTEFNPVLEYFNENLRKYTSLVYFTDGECYTDVKPKSHVLWVLSERSSMNDRLPGKVIRLEL
jgi:predicted metal-dependent peptidase